MPHSVLAGSTGLRRSELMALTWNDIDLELMLVNVRRSCVRNRVGDTKTEAEPQPGSAPSFSRETLTAWKEESPYPADNDFVFPSLRLHGKKPVTPDMILKKVIRPALERAGIREKVIGWHSFRHSLATNFVPPGLIYSAQVLMNHTDLSKLRWAVGACWHTSPVEIHLKLRIPKY
ncbi:MAG: site-specific integrase [Acidobacteriota bacterium]|nr:site-specific integrase [Acidobacteriota bacterium]